MVSLSGYNPRLLSGLVTNRLPPVIPPSLPPSVEEAYRRKCVQLKRRMNDVDEATATATVRLIRLRRGVEKLRLERAFLLEQLHRTLKTNNAVEGSEGTPSPPPTVCNSSEHGYFPCFFSD